MCGPWALSGIIMVKACDGHDDDPGQLYRGWFKVSTVQVPCLGAVFKELVVSWQQHVHVRGVFLHGFSTSDLLTWI